VARLAALFGSVDAMLGKLDDFFALAQATPPIYLSGNIRDKDPYYWHGNEPDIHAPYLYALAGRPDRGARWIEWVRRSKYSDGPDGLDGNDDAGTLSSWFILSSLGFYPLAGSDVWIIGLPLWPRAVIHRRSGDLVIRCEGPGADYAAAVSDRTQPRAVPVIGNLLVDGRAWSTPWITHAELAAAREVVFVLEYQAASAWGHVAPFGSSD
jgi:putative alpha-1,2-mannosidase